MTHHRTPLLSTIAALLLAVAALPNAWSQDAPVKVVKKVAPEFPAEATRKHVADGIIKARLSIGGDGAVTEVTVTSVSPPQARVFTPAAIEALNKWRFEAAGKSQTTEVTMVFQQD